MSEKQTDVEHALSAFGAPAIPYQKFNNGFVAALNEAIVTRDHRAGTAAFPLLAAALPALSSLTLDPIATSACTKGNNGPAASVDPGAQILAARPGSGSSSHGLVPPGRPIAASPLSAAGGVKGPTALSRSSEEAGGRVAPNGQLPITELFKRLGATPALHSTTTTRPSGDLRQLFRMLDRTD